MAKHARSSICSANNLLKSLKVSIVATPKSKAQVAQIFLAKTDALPNGRVAKPVDQADGSAVRNEFYDKVADKNAAQMKAYWAQLTFTGKAQPPRNVSGDAAVDGSVKVVFKP